MDLEGLATSRWGGLRKITECLFHRASLNHELAMRDRKKKYKELATAPLLCDLESVGHWLCFVVYILPEAE